MKKSSQIHPKIKLSKIQQKIIWNLDFNARMPANQLAKKCNVSKQVALYQLEKLQEQNIIQGFYTDINATKLGYSIYLVYLKFRKLTPIKEQKFIKHLIKIKGVGVSASITGSWDHCLGIWAQNVHEFQEILREATQNIQSEIKQFQVMIETDFWYFKPKQIVGKKSQAQITMQGKQQTTTIDQLDTLILAKLSQNARASLLTISKDLNVAANTIKNRIQKLQSNDLILSYRVMINWQKLGYLHHRVFLHLESLTTKEEEKLKEFLKQRLEVLSITKTIGYSSLEFRAVTKDLQEFNELIHSIRNEFVDILQSFDSILYTKFHQTLNYFPFNQ